MRRTIATVAALAALVPLAGCELFSLETEIPEMCIGFNDRLIPGVKGGMAFERSIVSDPLDTFGAYVELDAEITGARATLKVKNGAADLSFLDQLTVTLKGAGANSDIAPISLVSCYDYACASDTSESTLTNTPPRGVMDAIKAGMVEVEVTMQGDLPEQDWVVDIELCVSGKARAALEI
jgi:hypothetical protein